MAGTGYADVFMAGYVGVWLLIFWEWKYEFMAASWLQWN